MRRFRVNYKALITAYICMISLLGSYLLLNSQFLMNHNTPSELPLDFLLRFGIFWFVSFVLAFFFFAVHLRLHKYKLSDLEVAQSVKVGTYTFIAGISAATLSGIFFYIAV